MKDDSYERIDKMWETKAMEEKELLKAEIKKISEQQTTVLVAPEEIKEKVSPEKLTVEYNSS